MDPLARGVTLRGGDVTVRRVGFKELPAHALKLGEVKGLESGRQEFLENLINEFI